MVLFAFCHTALNPAGESVRALQADGVLPLLTRRPSHKRALRTVTPMAQASARQ